MVGIKLLRTSLNFHRIVKKFSEMGELRQFLLFIATYIGINQIGQYTGGLDFGTCMDFSFAFFYFIEPFAYKISSL